MFAAVARQSLGVALAWIAVLSLGATVAIAIAGGVDSETSLHQAVPVEAAAILVLLVLSSRRAETRDALVGGALATAALAALTLRSAESSADATTAAGVAVWTALGGVAATIGLHLRWLDAEQSRSVAEARRAQRAHLARDLHDFVAHDVSEMLAQAQAGQIVAGDHPCAGLFAQIEDAAQRALTSMDRTVQRLHPSIDPVTPQLPDGRATAIDDLAQLVARFGAVQGLDAVFSVEGAVDELPDEIRSTLHRVVVESLTNVRRHAPSATRVDVRMRRAVRDGRSAAVELTVSDDAVDAQAGRPTAVGRRQGLGLPGLRRHVEALGGTMSAGPGPAGGWQVTVTLPEARARRR